MSPPANASPNKSATFRDLMVEHQGAIRTFLLRLCANQALADDLAQDVFMRAYQKWEGLRDVKARKAWLFQIAYRVFLDHYRKTARRQNLAPTTSQEPDAHMSEASQNPGMKMDIETAMQKLPEAQRAAILLCVSYGLSNTEAAAALGLPLGTVKSHIARGKTALRGFLAAYERT